MERRFSRNDCWTSLDVNSDGRRECRAGACDPRSRASRSRDYTRNFIRVPRSSRSDPSLTRKERVGYGISNCLYRSAITEKI